MSIAALIFAASLIATLSSAFNDIGYPWTSGFFAALSIAQMVEALRLYFSTKDKV